jgi:hypothetical protein
VKALRLRALRGACGMRGGGAVRGRTAATVMRVGGDQTPCRPGRQCAALLSCVSSAGVRDGRRRAAGTQCGVGMGLRMGVGGDSGGGETRLGGVDTVLSWTCAAPLSEGGRCPCAPASVPRSFPFRFISHSDADPSLDPRPRGSLQLAIATRSCGSVGQSRGYSSFGSVFWFG